MNLNELTIIEAKKGLEEKEFSSSELVSACLSRLKEIDNSVKAFVTVCEKEALDQAREADNQINQQPTTNNQKPLLGIPIAVKDNFCTKGIKTTASSNVLKSYIPVYDATVIKKLKDAGAVILGKTNMDAWAHGSSTETSDFFTTHNPWNLERVPGGSSGGSAAAIAADMSIGAVGSETGGSIRQPASWCGVVGLKPTYGRASRYGLISMASSFDCPGPITKTVEDSALMLEVLSGHDEHDATTSSQDVANYLEIFKNLPRGLKIGIPKEYLQNIDSEVEAAVLKALERLKQMDCEIIEISLMDPKYAIAVYTILQRAEVSSNLARFDGIRYGNNRDFFGEEAKRRIMLGTYTLSSGYYDAYYQKAQKARTLICQDFDEAFKKVDLIIGPTSPTTALKIGESKESPMFGEIQDKLVEPSTIAGLPGLNLCCGFSKDILPIGMQIIGPQFSEEKILQLGYAYQKITDWHLKTTTL
jgi:aspartyl-tRNA(Asn)/glutamyl-tRNA(Gln) amidotransferase subunit A